MIKVTIWNEHIQEQLDTRVFDFQKDWPQEAIQRMAERAEEIHTAHNGGNIHDTLKALVEEDSEIEVRHIGTVEMPECGLSEEVLKDTDVLIWWSHIAQQVVPDEVAERVISHVKRGMGLICLHSAHMCKPMIGLLGTTCTLRWREGDRERMWCCDPTHPIAKDVPVCVWLEEEEMYGEYFDIPTPDELVFISNFEGGEVFRSGCVWKRGYGKLFYFQPGHETYRSYYNPDVRRIIRNAVHYVNPVIRLEQLDCIPV